MSWDGLLHGFGWVLAGLRPVYDQINKSRLIIGGGEDVDHLPMGTRINICSENFRRPGYMGRYEINMTARMFSITTEIEGGHHIQ